MGPEIKEQALHPAPNLLQFFSQVGPSHQRSDFGACFSSDKRKGPTLLSFCLLTLPTNDASVEAACPRGA